MRETVASVSVPFPEQPLWLAPEHQLRPSPPRSRLFGGDRIRGGEPVGVGHAGKPPHHPLLQALMAVVLFIFSFTTMPRPALAATTITFSNGQTATLNADGSIDGSCTVQRSTAFALYRDGDPNDPGPSVPTPFYVTMPDGQHIVAYCQDGENYAPRNGSIPFTAYPTGGGSYRVWIWGNRVGVNTAEVAAWNAAGRGLYYPPQRLFASSWKPSVQGDIALSKTSADIPLSSSSASYSLAGAVYGIYSDAACTEEVARMVTDAGGRAKSGMLDAGVYWVREISPSPGFALDTAAHRLTIESGKTTNLSVSERPQYQPVSLLLTKVDADTGEPIGQGSASLAGARFLVRFFGNADGSTAGVAKRSWVLVSDEQGRVLMDEDHLESGDEFFRDGGGAAMLPLGTLAIQEISAPQGYYLEGQDPSSDEPYDAPIHTVVIKSEGTETTVPAFAALSVPNSAKRGGISLDKDDVETVDVQGDGRLSGVVFEVVNRNEGDVVVSGTRFAPGEVVTTLITNDAGGASTEPDLLPLGTYEVREAVPGIGYLNTSEPQTITVAEPNAFVLITPPFPDRIIRGGLRVAKVGAETYDGIPQGGASLAGARFSITSRCDAPVLVDGALYKPGEVVAVVASDEHGIAETPADALPYGTYEVREIEAPEGYLLDTAWSQTVFVEEDGAIYDITATDQSAHDQVKRGGFSFNKVDEQTMASMTSVAFLITAQDDPDGDGVFEQHVVVTDENGIFDSEYAPHSYLTNANDAAYDPESGSVNESLLDPAAGLWFSGRTDRTVEADDSLMALPYGTYTVQELPCPGNAGHMLVTFTLRVTRHDYVIARGTIDDKPGPRIATQLVSEAGKVVPAAEGPVVLTDRIFYANLEPGTMYVFAGELVDRDTGEALGITATKEVAVYAPAGTVELEFAIDPATIGSAGIVAYEELWLDGSCIAEHKDIADEGQTVLVPSLSTELSSAEGNEVAASAGETVVLTDTVSYRGLWPGETYRVQGELVDKATGASLGIGAASSFTAEASEGEIEVVFEIPAELVAGKALVCFETLYREDHMLAVHADLKDEAQTIAVPALRTSLSTEGGEKLVGDAEDTVVLVDTVSFCGVAVGHDYRLSGVLVDKETREIISEGGTTFTATSSEDSVEVGFTVDAAQCRGRELVAFEELYLDDALIAEHADIDDEGQTVRFAQMGTSLSGAGGEYSVTAASFPTVLVDTVSYRGLVPGETYVIAGQLVDKADGTPLGIDAQVEFVPDTPSGTAEVVFTCPAEAVAGKDVVAFETLMHEGREVLVHADLEDADQTISIPWIGTVLAETPGGRKTVEKGVFTLVDTVTFENLDPGTTYVVEGRLMDAATGEPFTDPDGNPVTGRTVLEPADATGTCEVVFSVDARGISAPTQLVAFETVSIEDGTTVAIHEDLGNADQTVAVTVPAPSGKKPLPATGDDAEPVEVRIAAAAGALLAIASTVVSIRTNPRTGEGLLGHPNRRKAAR